VGLEYLQRRRLHSLPGQPVQCSITLRGKKFFLMFRQNLPEIYTNSKYNSKMKKFCYFTRVIGGISKSSINLNLLNTLKYLPLLYEEIFWMCSP